MNFKINDIKIIRTSYKLLKEIKQFFLVNEIDCIVENLKWHIFLNKNQ